MGAYRGASFMELYSKFDVSDKALQSAFECPLNPQCCHAIRNENPTINTDSEYVTNAKVLISTFLGNSTELFLQLENGHHVSVLTQERHI